MGPRDRPPRANKPNYAAPGLECLYLDDTKVPTYLTSYVLSSQGEGIGSEGIAKLLCLPTRTPWNEEAVGPP
jgi:hypothetical protein